MKTSLLIHSENNLAESDLGQASQNASVEPTVEPNADTPVDVLISIAKVAQAELNGFETKAIEPALRIGMALTFAKANYKKQEGNRKKTWNKFLKENGISITTDWRVRKLYERFKTPEEVGELTLTEAYVEAGALMKKAAKETGKATETDTDEDIDKGFDKGTEEQSSTGTPMVQVAVEQSTQDDDLESQTNSATENNAGDNTSPPAVESKKPVFYRLCDIQESLESLYDDEEFPLVDAKDVRGCLLAVSKILQISADIKAALEQRTDSRKSA